MGSWKIKTPPKIRNISAGLIQMLQQLRLLLLLLLLHGVEANDGNNTGNGKFAHLAASSRT